MPVIITPQHLVDEARGLRSEHGENPEYDRALVELTMRLFGAGEDERRRVERLILDREVSA